MKKPPTAQVKRMQMFAGIAIGGVLLLAGLGAVVTLNANSQDLRQQAAGSADYFACTNARDCKLGENCVEGKCVVSATPTVIPAGQACIDNKCTAGLRCVNGVCIFPPTTPTPITTSQDCTKIACPNGFHCVYGKCLSCVNGSCIELITPSTGAKPTLAITRTISRVPTKHQVQVRVTLKCSIISKCPSGYTCSAAFNGICKAK